MKTLLVATTALVGVSLAVSGELLAREPAHLGLNANETFLCDYGAYYVSFAAPSFSQTGLVEDWTRAAVPVKGTGGTVTGIEVANSFYAPSGGYLGLSVAIYSSRHNKPFKPLAGVWTAASGCPVTLSVDPIQLRQGKRYWVVEKTDPMFGSPSVIVPAMWGYNWFYRTTKTHGAIWQSGSSGCSGSTYENCHLHHSGAWQAITGGTPYVKLITGAQERGSIRPQSGRPLSVRKMIYRLDVHVGDSTPLPTRAANRGPP